MRITKEQADEILGDDLSPCEADVKRLVKVALGQHQFDALVSFTFNCGAGNLKKLVLHLNDGNYDDIPKRLMQFVSSKGERMKGLVNRRNGEVVLWNTPDDPDEAEVQEVFSPKGDENDPPKTMVESKTGNSALALGGGSAVVGISALNDAAGPIKQAVGNAKELGLTDFLANIVHSPFLLMAIAMIGLAGFIWWDRNRKLQQEHI